MLLRVVGVGGVYGAHPGEASGCREHAHAVGHHVVGRRLGEHAVEPHGHDPPDDSLGSSPRVSRLASRCTIDSTDDSTSRDRDDDAAVDHDALVEHAVEQVAEDELLVGVELVELVEVVAARNRERHDTTAGALGCAGSASRTK